MNKVQSGVGILIAFGLFTASIFTQDNLQLTAALLGLSSFIGIYSVCHLLIEHKRENDSIFRHEPMPAPIPVKRQEILVKHKHEHHNYNFNQMTEGSEISVEDRDGKVVSIRRVRKWQ